ncbi:MAG TPA: lytic transglycosylase domain-containing protein [Stellaceae bacterium]|nr:lytic transglycosylase domain-containing protein [Stellaceae bacterium]
MNGWERRRRSSKTYAALFVIAVFSAALFAFHNAAAGDLSGEFELAALTPPSDFRNDTDLPYVLNGADAERYRLIELQQRTAQWQAADHEIASLKDRLLLGHVLAQRYIHPRYRASYAELAAWLDAYGDQPEAGRIYNLALKRAPEGAKPPKPSANVLAALSLADGDLDPHPAHADVDAAGSPNGLWQAGLTAWRDGHLDEARKAFSTLATAPAQSPWTVSAAAFWTARVELRSRHPADVARWLGLAANHPHTFYGLLARRLLGVDTDFNFVAAPFTAFDAGIMTGVAAGRRAVAELEIGDQNAAAAELRLMAARGSTQAMQAAIALADHANLPALSLQLGAIVARRDGQDYDRALYPIPRWMPRGGFTVDRALLFGVMRQESKFAPHVVSNAGARGLMQLMPATARSMATQLGQDVGDRRGEREQLADPATNMMLAQEYVRTLLQNDHIRGNLLFFALAYNGGPGAVERRKTAMANYRADPLLFLETFPVAESRAFTERVMANYWIYRLRLGQPTPDLDALAEGHWPIYTAFDMHDSGERRVADNR